LHVCEDFLHVPVGINPQGISAISSSARPRATARLPIDSAERVAAPSELSAATAIRPTIIVEATTSTSDRAARRD
jgi:hypothetical protein